MRGEERMLELQEIDLAVDHLETRRAELVSGSEVHAASEVAERAETQVGELRLAIDSVGREQRQLERDIDTLESKRTAEEKRMYDGSIVNQKELGALQHEIENVRQRRSRFEDELLERMEKLERLEEQVNAAEKDLVTARERLEALGGESAEELRSIDAQLAERRGAREALTPEIDPDLLDLYGDLRASKKGVGAAALVDGTCQGCHQSLSAVVLNKLKHSQDIKRCEYCRRILIFP
jgi:predicted  nucleic acid-binding Zn-ribbon protein